MLHTPRTAECRRSILRLDMDDLYWKQSTLLDQAEQARLDFIKTDLEMCFTLTDIVETEYGLGNQEHAERTLAKAEKGYSTLVRLVSKTEKLPVEIESELQTRLKKLRDRLDQVKRPR